MASVPAYYAVLSVSDSQQRVTNVELRVDATDGKAYVAAADDATRAASKVGLLLDAIFDVINSSLGGVGTKFTGVYTRILNGSWSAFTPDAEVFNSNKLNVSMTTTNAGMPAKVSFSIPQRNPAAYDMESNGLNLDLVDDPETANLVAQINDTVLSVYGTAVSVVEITVNDS